MLVLRFGLECFGGLRHRSWRRRAYREPMWFMPIEAFCRRSMVWFIMWRTKVRSSSVIVVVERAWGFSQQRALRGDKEAGKVQEGKKTYFVKKYSAIDYEEVV